MEFVVHLSVNSMQEVNKSTPYQGDDHRPRLSWRCACAMRMAPHGGNGLSEDVQIGAALRCSCHGYQSKAVKKKYVLELQETSVTNSSTRHLQEIIPSLTCHNFSQLLECFDEVM